MTIKRYRKSGAGGRLGGAWTEAKALEALRDDLKLAAPGDVFLIGFDRDREDPVFWAETMLHIEASGSKSAPIRLEAGYVGHADDVQPVGIPADMVLFRLSGGQGYARTQTAIAGAPFLTVGGGASNLTLAGFSLTGAPGSGFISFLGAEEPQRYAGIVISGLSASRIGRVVDAGEGTRLRSVLIENCDAYGIIRGFARFDNIAESVLRDLFLDAAFVDSDLDCKLIAIDRGRDLTFENIWLRNAVTTRGPEKRGSSYAQGDGIVCERGTSSCTFRNCHATGMGDGGFDLKTEGFVMEDSSADRCKFGLRVWSAARNVVRRSSFTNPRNTGGNDGACLWAAGRAEIIDSHFQAGPGTSVFRFDEAESGPPHLRLSGGSIRLDGNAVLVRGSAGTVELAGVSVNGEQRTETIRFEGGKRGQ